MVPSSEVSASAQLYSVGYSLAAVVAWGTSDFLGGYATRRTSAFLFTTIVNVGGLVLMVVFAAGTQSQFPSSHTIRWALAAGASAGGSLAVFYAALSRGNMGLTAPVAAVLSAAIPTLVGIVTQGWPGAISIAGFAVAAAGLWLITRADAGGSPKGLPQAIVAGCGFAGFYLCIHQAGEGSVFWMAALTRTGGFAVTGLVALALLDFRGLTIEAVSWGVLTGLIDSLGTVLFIRAGQTGRLDEAVVLSSLYPAVTVLLARLVLKERFTRWRVVGLLAALVAVPMIASG